MMIRSRQLFTLILLGASVTASAQSCALPQPFAYTFQNQGTAALQGTDPATACTLNASLDASASSVAAAIAHYRRSSAATSLRYGFRVDHSAIAAALSLANRQVQLFSVSGVNIVGAPPVSLPVSHLFNVTLVGGGDHVSLRMSAACTCAANPSNTLVAIEALTQGANELRFEINTGAGAAGLVRYWIDADFSDAPTGIIDNQGAGLDNAAWGGIVAAQLGLSSPTNQFRNDNNGGAVVFDQIESTDDTVFWQDFESGWQ